MNEEKEQYKKTYVIHTKLKMFNITKILKKTLFAVSHNQS